MDKLNLINTFLAVSRMGSFSAASAYLGIDPSTASKAIQQLERHLEVRLFIRTTRKLQLTHAGEQYQTSCVDLLDGLAHCEEQLHQQQVDAKGLLKINLPVAYGQLYILPMIGRFNEQYPEIQLDISLNDDYVDMVSHSIDIAVRSGQLKDSRLIAKQLSPMDFATCAAPSFLSNRKAITAANINKQPWILYRFNHTGKVMPLTGVKGNDKNKQYYDIAPSHAALVTTDGLSMLTACKAGVGLMQAPHFIIRDALKNGELQLVQPYYRSKLFKVSAYYLHRGYVPAKVRAFLNFLVDELNNIGENHQSTFLSLTKPCQQSR
jgi:DNA-binding transcriptional LysR family regulator